MNSGLHPDFITNNQDAIILTGTIFLIVGGLLYILIWSPAKEGHWPWIGTAVVGITLAFGGLVSALCVWAFLFIVFYFSRRNTEENS